MSLCTPATLNAYYTQLDAWTACQTCARQGFGAVQNADGSWRCDESKQRPGAAVQCDALAPQNTCFPTMRNLNPTQAWERTVPAAQHSWGTSVFEPQYNDFVLWGTWNEKKGRPYLTKEAPYDRNC